MSEHTKNLKNSLINVDDSVLIVIDIQDRFLTKYGDTVSRRLIENAVWLIECAKAMDVPVVAMAENIPQLGPLSEKVHSALPEGAVVHSKDSFGLAGQPEILADVAATGRKTAILIGVETDVCVAQSALGLLKNGYQIAVAKDAVATTSGGDEIGLERMKGAGAVISSVKAIYYEWLSSVSNSVALSGKNPDLKRQLPSSIEL